MSIYLDKLAHVQVVINCPYSVPQFCTGKDMLAHISGTPSIDDVMSYNSLTTSVLKPVLNESCFIAESRANANSSFGLYIRWILNRKRSLLSIMLFSLLFYSLTSFAFYGAESQGPPKVIQERYY